MSARPADEFRTTWYALSKEGVCDSIDGEEYERVFSEWLDADRPDPEPFIRYRPQVKETPN